MFTERQGIIVWLHSLKQVKTLRKFGNIHYVSKKLKYAVVYCNMKDIEHLMNKLSSFPFVKRVEVSQKPFIKVEFEGRKHEKEKEDEYKIGI